MTKRSDTIIRYGLLALAAGAVVAMFAVAGNESLSRVARFSLLTLLGAIATGSWVTIDLANPFPERNPLMARWGRAARPSGSRVNAPAAIASSSDTTTFKLRTSATFGALAAAVAGGIVSGIVGYALAGSARTDGGLIVYIVFAGAALLAARSAIRLVSASWAITLRSENLTIGPALGYLPARSVARSDVSAIEIAADPPAKIAIVSHAGRRYEIRTDSLDPPGLAGYLAGTWPELQWHDLPASQQRV